MPSWGPPSFSLNLLLVSSSPRLWQQKSFLTFIFPQMKAEGYSCPQRHLRKISRTRVQSVKSTLFPMLKDEAETTRTPQNDSIFSAACVHPLKEESGEQGGGQAVKPPASASAHPPPCPPPARRSVSTSGSRELGPRVGSTSDWTVFLISCETCFKPPNHKNGRFS